MARLRDYVRSGLARGDAYARLSGPDQSYRLADLLDGQVLAGPPADYAGTSVLLWTSRQESAAAALVALDGLARRIVLCPPDFKPEHLSQVVALADIDLIVSDDEIADAPVPVRAMPGLSRSLEWAEVAPVTVTQWALFTSGTTGLPKLVAHTLDTLTGAIRAAPPSQPGAAPIIWATYYDIRRYGGLQILLRALLGGASLGVTGPHEAVGDFLARLQRLGVTHLTGTPSHWRHALMSPRLHELGLSYVRLSGEIADQAILDRLQAVFPQARVGHAYASTEAGVGFEVTDGKEGFPAAYLDRSEGPVAMKLVDGVLHIRSDRAAARYLGADAPALVDAEAWVNTDDMVEVRADRCLFMGRKAGLINVGGLKIHPEEVEAVINRHPDVDLSRVYARRSPITGALVAAEVVTRPDRNGNEMMKQQILAACRDYLGAAKTPVSLAFVPALPMTAGGKLERKRG